MDVKFKKCLISTDVTAIRFVGNFVIAGIGGSIHIFVLQSSKLLLTSDIFSGQKIHGIEIRNKYQISIFGGKKLAHCTLNLNGSADASVITISDLVYWQHSDWILHLKWLAGDTVAVVTAHNNVSLHDSTGKIIMQATCQEKCIVYCALLVGRSWADLIVLAGTVFQEVVVWTVRKSVDMGSADSTLVSRDSRDGTSQVQDFEDRTSDCSDCPVMHRLKGHNGVIFSVSYDAMSRTLATTSDDRSVRTWRVSANWSHITVQHAMFGHRARAWRGLAISGGATLSVGEDGALCVWTDDGRLARRWDAHPGARVWCVDHDERSGLVATGGGDGGVCIWPLRSSLAADLSPSLLPLPPTHVPRRVRLVSSVLAAATEHGALVSTTIDASTQDSTADGITPLITAITIAPQSTATPSLPPPWTTAYSSPRLASYSLLESSPSGHLVAVAAMDGWLAVFRHGGAGLALATQGNVAQGKVFSMRWVAEDALLVCADRGLLTVWVLVTERDGEERLLPTRRLTLPAAKEAWPTAAALFVDLLVCGDRAGNIHVFSLPEWRSEDDTVTAAVQTFPRLHGRLGVTCVCARGPRLWTGGRDGAVRQFARAGVGLVPIAADKVPLPWVADFVESELGLLMLGFREVEFVVWSWTEQCTLLSVECGGGHRSWDFRLSAGEGAEFKLVHVKDKAVHTLCGHLRDLVRPVLQMGFHSKEIGCVRLLRNPHRGHPLVVSASEDTTIRFSRLQIALKQTCTTTRLFGSHSQACQMETHNAESLHEDPCREYVKQTPVETGGDELGSAGMEAPAALATLATLRSHVSSVRALAFNSDQSLLFSAGGRAQLKVWSVSYDAAGELAVTERADHMLRKRAQRPWREAMPAADPETRYMDLCCMPALVPAETLTTLAAGCSDGRIRFFTYDPACNSLLMMQETSFHERCVLKVSCLVAPNSRHVLVSMATDGRCAFWSRSQTASATICSEPFALLQLHQSGVNSFDWKLVPSESADGIFVFATGGDDNAMVLTLLELAADNVVVLAQKRIESLHAAQITGICFVDSFVVSACIDQCVRVWRWDVALGAAPSLECALLSQYTSTVSDIQGLLVWSTASSRASALVHGKGMEVIDFDLT